MNSWWVLRSGPGTPAFNMAMDEALLESMPRLQKPVLRFYGWTKPAASFGYFQNYSAIEKATRLRPLIRRPTGGGLVPHDADWTYSLVFPAGHEWHGLRAIESYRRVHEWIRLALVKLGVPATLAEGPRRSGAGQCFEGYEMFDVLWSGKKIAGAAQRRTHSGLLIQGSVQPPPISLDRSAWEKAMVEAGNNDVEPEWAPFDDDEAMQGRVEELVSAKYSRDSYNRKR